MSFFQPSWQYTSSYVSQPHKKTTDTTIKTLKKLQNSEKSQMKVQAITTLDSLKTALSLKTRLQY